MNDRIPLQTPLGSRVLWLLLALVMAAYVLRMIDMERRPLHFDESINVTMGHRSPEGVLNMSRETYDNDPPGHRLTLGAWMGFVGPSAFSIRILSVFFGALTVAATYRALRATRLGFLPSAVAASLLAFAPYAIDYSQQAKGYAMGAAMTMISWWAWIAMSRRRSSHVRPAFIAYAFSAYALSTALALSTHYYTIFLLPMQWLWFVGTRFDLLFAGPGQTRQRIWRGVVRLVRRGEVIRALAAQAVACVPIGVWLLLMWASLQVSTMRSSTKFEPASPLALLGRILGEMSAGQFASGVLASSGAFIVTAAAIIGGVCLWKQTIADHGGAPAWGRSAFWFSVSILVPLAGAVAMQQRVTFFFPRFLLYAMPNLCALCAGSVLLLTRGTTTTAALRWVPASAVAVILAAGSVAFRQAPIDAENDYRPLVATVRPWIKSGDAALGAYIWMEGMFTSYAPETGSSLRWYKEVYSQETVEDLLKPIACNHPRIWSVNFQRNPDAPEVLSTLWLKRFGAYADRVTWGASSVLLFDTACPTQVLSSDDTPPAATFGGVIGLDYDFVPRQAAQGDTLDVTLKWSALRPVSEQLTPFVHLIGPDGQMVAQSDGDALNGLAPSFTWAVGETIVDRRAVLIRTPLAAGEYALVAGIYRRSDGARMTTDDGADHVSIGTVKVPAKGSR